MDDKVLGPNRGCIKVQRRTYLQDGKTQTWQQGPIGKERIEQPGPVRKSKKNLDLYRSNFIGCLRERRGLAQAHIYSMVFASMNWRGGSTERYLQFSHSQDWVWLICHYGNGFRIFCHSQTVSTR
jgi:hypothetical protein